MKKRPTPVVSGGRRHAQSRVVRPLDPPPYLVTFHNPGVGVVRTRWWTRTAAEKRVAHYARKYGQFTGYKRAAITELGVR